VFARYGIESVVSRIDDLYEKILEARPSRAQRKVARRRSATAPRKANPSALSNEGTG
jgi:hypothetical protein